MGEALIEELDKLTDDKLNIYLNTDISTRYDPPTNPQGGLTEKKNLKGGWIKAPSDSKEVIPLKNKSKGNSGNIKIDTSTKGKQQPIKEK
jgi:hypothetical protein